MERGDHGAPFLTRFVGRDIKVLLQCVSTWNFPVRSAYASVSLMGLEDTDAAS